MTGAELHARIEAVLRLIAPDHITPIGERMIREALEPLARLSAPVSAGEPKENA